MSSRTNPRVLVLGLFEPDSFVRWLADGFTLAGCQVVRCGRLSAPPGWPEAEFPVVREYPGAARKLGEAADVPIDVDPSGITAYFKDLRFTPRLVVLDTAGGWCRPVPALGCTDCPVVVLDPVPERPWGRRYSVDHAPCDLWPGVDLNVFRPAPRGTVYDGIATPPGYELTDADRAVLTSRVVVEAPFEAPCGIRDQVSALWHSTAAFVPVAGAARERWYEWRLRACACGTRTVSALHYRPLTVDALINDETWLCRASRLLSDFGVEPGGADPGMPRHLG